jgi:hypothetical protein
MPQDDSSRAHLLIQNDDRVVIMVDNKPHVLVQPPSWAVEYPDGDAKLVKKLETGSAVLYTDAGVDLIIFDADIDEVIESRDCDIFEQEQIDKLEMYKIDVAWFV